MDTTKTTYAKTINLKHNQIAAKIDLETGEVTTIEDRPNNIPEGTSKLNYVDFSIVNNQLVKKLNGFLTNEELGIIYYMISMSDFNSNSLAPLCDELSIRDKAQILNIKKDRVKKITDKLYKFGVYLSIRVYEDQEREYWVLNPHISWRGRLVKDSIFYHFKDTMITKLLQ